MQLILIRHPETTYNAAANKYCGRTDAELSDKGRQQAAGLSRYFATMSVSGIWSSPLVRALVCAEAIAEPHRMPVSVAPGLTEFDFGAWEGLRPAEIRERDPELWRQWNEGHPFAGPPGGETPLAVYKRAVKAVENIVATGPAEHPVLIVAHDQLIRMLFTFFLRLPFSHFRQLGQPKNGSLCRVQANVAKGTWRMLSYSESV